MKMMKWKKHFTTLAVLTILSLMIGGAQPAAAAGLAQHEEIQSVMGDLSALTTAAQMYFSENPHDSRAPPLSSILHYFDENSIPRDASSRFAIMEGDGGWYVGHRAFGLRGGTHRQLEGNAISLGLVGDDLHSPWRRGNTYIWTNALALSAPSSGLVIRNSRRLGGAEVAKLLIGTAVLINAINDRHCHRRHYFSRPGQPWNWRSSLVYRPFYRQRFYTHFSRPPARPVPLYRPPIRRVPPPPARRGSENRRSYGSRPHSRR